MADSVIEALELERQQESLVTAMKEAEAVLEGEQHEEVTKLLWS
jgi:hypothetical protein